MALQWCCYGFLSRWADQGRAVPVEMAELAPVIKATITRSGRYGNQAGDVLYVMFVDYYGFGVLGVSLALAALGWACVYYHVEMARLMAGTRTTMPTTSTPATTTTGLLNKPVPDGCQSGLCYQPVPDGCQSELAKLMAQPVPDGCQTELAKLMMAGPQTTMPTTSTLATTTTSSSASAGMIPTSRHRVVTPLTNDQKIVACIRDEHLLRPGQNAKACWLTCQTCKVHAAWKITHQPDFNMYPDLRAILQSEWQRFVDRPKEKALRIGEASRPGPLDAVRDSPTPKREGVLLKPREGVVILKPRVHADIEVQHQPKVVKLTKAPKYQKVVESAGTSSSKDQAEPVVKKQRVESDIREDIDTKEQDKMQEAAKAYYDQYITMADISSGHYFKGKPWFRMDETDDMKCYLCNKYATHVHVNSDKHQLREERCIDHGYDKPNFMPPGRTTEQIKNEKKDNSVRKVVLPDETSKYDHKYNLHDRKVIDGFTQHPSLNGWTVEIEGFASDGRYHVAVVEPTECIGFHLRWVKEVNWKGLVLG